MERYLVTSALPYANGKLHIGHVAGAYLPADIFVRYLRLQKKDVVYICGTDEHGAPISIEAEARGITPKELVDLYHESIAASFAGLGIEFDNFSGTARAAHRELSQEFFLNLLKKGYISTHATNQFYCEQDKRFLADRYVEGKCPYCGDERARGDQCDACGKLIDAVTLIGPKCKICGETPVIRKTSHWFLDLPKFEPQLRAWLSTKTYWKDNVHNFITSWLDNGLIERSITRDIDWGVPVPLANADDKVLYVWFDAPIGYISATKEWAEQQGEPEKWKEYWLSAETKLIHFIGKDNIPFHTIIWPALLLEQDKAYVLPYDVPANEYLSLEGEKISTSRKYAIWVEDFLKNFDGELLRYMLAVNAPENKDADFTWKEFQQRVNNDLANILGNLANRVFTFACKNFGGVLPKPEVCSEDTKKLIGDAREIFKEVETCYANYKVRKATKLCLDVARLGNQYFDFQKPWVTFKTDPAQASQTLYACCKILYKLSIAFYPIMPKTMLKLRSLLNVDNPLSWENMEDCIDAFRLNSPSVLFQKIENDVIDAQIESLKASLATSKQSIAHKENIGYDDFAKLELRLVKILRAQKVEKSDKILKVQVEIGDEKRTVMAGIGKNYEPQDLVGKTVVMLVNLTPKKIMGEISSGMLLAAVDEAGNLSLLSPQNDKIHVPSIIS